MSRHDYAQKSGYGHNAHSYVTKIETYVEEVRKPRVIEYTYPISPVKIEPKAIHDHNYSQPYSHPPEVEDLITKILNEVNSPPTYTSTTLPASATYWGHRVPVRVESRSDYPDDSRYGSPPSKQDYGSWNKNATTGNPTKYGVPSQQPQGGHDYPNNQWGRFSHPEYNQPPKRESYGPGNQPTRREPYGSNNQWEAPTSKPETRMTLGVPDTHWRGSYKSDSTPQYGVFHNQGAPKNKWSDPPTNSCTRQDYGGSTNPSYFKPEASRDERDPNKRWDDSPIKSQTIGDDGIPKDYRGPIYQWGGTPTTFNSQHDYTTPNNPSLSKPKTLKDQEALHNQSIDHSPMKPHPVGDSRVPDKQWGSSPTKSQTRQDYGVPFKPESPKDHGAPYNQWGSSPKNPLGLGNYGVPNNQQNISSSPDFYHHSDKQSPSKFETSKDYGVPENKWSNGDPNRHWDRPSSPVYHNPPNTQFSTKPKTHDEQGNPLMKQQTRQDHGIPSDPWNKSSSPSYEPQSPSMTCKDGVCTLNDKPKVTHGPYEEPKGNNSYNYPKDTTIGHPQNDKHYDYGNDGRRSNPYNYDHQPEKDNQIKNTNRMNPSVNDNTHTSTPLGKVGSNIGEALGQLTIGDGVSPGGIVGKSSNPTNLASSRVGFSVPGHPRDSAYIQSVPSRPYLGWEDPNRTITSKEALQKYNGSSVPK